jgi:hypothetical protein
MEPFRCMSPEQNDLPLLSHSGDARLADLWCLTFVDRLVVPTLCMWISNGSMFGVR